MPWIHRMLRGQKVLARCEDDGTLRLEEGRVEIRYKPQDGRAYRAYPSNLQPAGEHTVLPDEHCAPAGAAPERKTSSDAASTDAGAAGGAAKKAAPKKAASKKAATKTAGGVSPADHHEHDAHTKALTVYADGACSGNPGPAGLGVVIYDEHEKRELSEFLGRATNNIAELTAILRAAEALVDETRPIVLKTDSQYSIGVLTKGWKAKANPDLIADVKAALAKVPHMKIRYVEGHAGHAGNERADELARAAVEGKRTSGWKTHKKLRAAE
jgi:ribonuclease HI